MSSGTCDKPCSTSNRESVLGFFFLLPAKQCNENNAKNEIHPGSFSPEDSIAMSLQQCKQLLDTVAL